MKKDIYTIKKESDILDSFFECITSCSISSKGIDCTTDCYINYLEPKNFDYPLNFYSHLQLLTSSNKINNSTNKSASYKEQNHKNCD